MSQQGAQRFPGGLMHQSRPSWFAVYTKSRQEHIALLNLERQSFECFLPMAENPYQRRGNKNESRHEPLFSRYLFLNAFPEIQDLATVRSTRGVVGLVRSGFELIRVPESIITGLKTRMDPATGLIAVNPVPLNNGDKVRIFDGPFAGLEGVLKEQHSEIRTVLLLKMLGAETIVEVDSLLLQRVA